MIHITVYKLNKKLIKISKKECALFFSDSESLTKAILFLIDSNIKLSADSSLYISSGNYVLILKNLNRKFLTALNEFCYFKTENKIKIESVLEYGKPIIKNNAIKRYGVAFLKN